MEHAERIQYFDELERHFASIRVLAQRLDFSEQSRVKLLQAAGAIVEERSKLYSSTPTATAHLTTAETDQQWEREQRELRQQRLDREEMDRRRLMAEEANKGAGKL